MASTSVKRPPTVSMRSAVRRTVQPWSARAKAAACRPSPAGRQSASFCRSVSARVIGFSDCFLSVFGTVEGQEGGLAVDDRFDVNRAGPHALHIDQDVAGVVQLQFDPVVVVLQE